MFRNYYDSHDGMSWHLLTGRLNHNRKNNEDKIVSIY